MSSSSNEIPHSPRHLLRISTSSTESFALSDALTDARSFASVSAAAFSAVTAPSTAAPPPRKNGFHRYNTRLASRTSLQEIPPNIELDYIPNRPEPTIHHRHTLPERVSHLLATATSNARLVRAMNKSAESQQENFDANSTPLLASTPSKSSNGSGVPLFQPILSSNSTITVGSSTGPESNDDSVIVLDETREDDVFQFTAAEDKNESNSDSVVIVSPAKQGSSNDSELVEESENLNNSICVTRHKVNRVCPITKLPFRVPVRNACGHVYEKNAIWEMYLARMRRSKHCPCPVAGCEGKVWYSQLTSTQ